MTPDRKGFVVPEDLQIARAFQEIAEVSVVQIFGKSKFCECQGTGCIVGTATFKDNKQGFLIATAGHVIKDLAYPEGETEFRQEERAEIDWKIKRVGSPNNNPTDKIIQEISFPGYKKISEGVDVFCKIEELDIGYLITPGHDDGGSPVHLFPGRKIPIAKDRALPEPSTRVAWCGFPGRYSSITGYLPLCYYEGSVSHLVDTPDKPPILLIDGHNDSGVSGGPAWFYNKDTDQVELFGIVSSYIQDPAPLGPRFPGLMCAMAMFPVIERAEAWAREILQKNGSDR